jgi:hypothetical protein
MNFQERVNYIFINAHRQLDDKLNGRKWVDLPFVHEFLDSLAEVIYKYGAEYDYYLNDRESKKRLLSGAKDIPTDAKSSYDAQKLRIQQNKMRSQDGFSGKG